MIESLDHLVLTVESLERCCDFYVAVLGMRRVDADDLPTALHFGDQKIHVHEVGHTFDPKARVPTPGSADLCFVTSSDLDEVVGRLADHDVAIEVGPVDRLGARGPMRSVYVRDPDGNLVEISRYPD